MRKIALHLFLFFQFLVFFAPEVFGKTPEALKIEAQRYYWGKQTKQDYKKALELYEQAAQLGDPEAQFIAGGMYYTGKGTEPDLKRAFDLLTVAAEQGESSPEAQQALAVMYLNGEVVPQNYLRALKLFTLAAESGLKDAQNELGFMYYVGKGVEKDFNKAFEWFEKAAYQGDSLAQFNTGMIWYLGNSDMGSDLVKAYAWFGVASAAGNQGAARLLEHIRPVLSPEEISHAQQLSSQIYKTIASSQGN